MDAPSLKLKGLTRLREWADQVTRAINANKIVPGIGTSVSETNHGRVLSAVIAKHAKGGEDTEDIEAGPPMTDRCWVIGSPTLFWPEKVGAPAYRAFPSDEPGWWWHHFCFRTMLYTRNVATGALSNRRVFTGFWDPTDFDSLVVETANWYEPTAAEVTDMLTYAPAEECSGPATATMEVGIYVSHYRERQWTNSNYPTNTAWLGWTNRFVDESSSWPLIDTIVWRYV